MDDVTKFTITTWIKRIIVIVIIISIVILGLFELTSISFRDLPEEDLRAVPWTSVRYGREGKMINFTASKSTGDITRYHWDFGNGITSDKIDPSNVYESSDWYKVTLIVEDKSGNTDNDSIIIDVQPVSEDSFKIVDEIINLGDEPLYGGGLELRVGPNIEQPKVRIYVNLYEPYGRFTINITLKTWLEDNTITYEELLVKSFDEHKGDGILFDHFMPQPLVPEIVQDHYSTIELSVYIDQGRWYSANFEMYTVFYIERLHPPDM